MERVLRCFEAGEGGTRLTLKGLGLSQLPPGLHRLTHLRDLDVSGNENLSRLPDDLTQCKNLERIVADDCSISALPSRIGALKQLQEVSFAFNELRTLPDSIGQCANLASISVPGCKLREVPASLANLDRLTKLDVASNPDLSDLPGDIDLQNLAVYSTNTRLALMSRVFTAPAFDPETRQNLSHHAAVLRDQWSGLSGRISPDARVRIDQLRQGASTTLSNADHDASAAWQAAADKVSKWAEKGVPVTMDRIRKLNQLLLQDADDAQIGGQLREVNVQAADGNRWTNHRYPPPESLEREIGAFSEWLRSNDRRSHASDVLEHVEFAAQVHQRLASLHPFQDANGRTARLVMDWILQRHGLPPAPPVGDASRLPASFLGGRRVSAENVVLEALEGMALVVNEAHRYH